MESASEHRFDSRRIRHRWWRNRTGLVRQQIGWLAMTRKQIKAITCAIFHDGIVVDKLSDKAKDELRKAVAVLLAKGTS
jgi:hypothetical protein